MPRKNSQEESLSTTFGLVKDPFPDGSIFDPLDDDQKVSVELEFRR